MKEKNERKKCMEEKLYVDKAKNQLVLTEDGRTIDLTEKQFKIIDEDDYIEFTAGGEIIKAFAKEKLSYENFIQTYIKNSETAVLLLLAIQSNKAPLKKGGIDIAYMSDLLFDHMLSTFSEEASIVWEALCAMQSSRPEDKKFILTPADIEPYTNYKNKENLYRAFKKGATELSHINLEFDIVDPDRDGHNVVVHWNDGSEWVGRNKSTGEGAHFAVYTNDFYRALMTSSGIIHGTHWNRRMARSLKGYARTMYLFCARNKNYTKYKGAIPGVKELSIDEIRYEFQFDEKIENKAITRHLKNAQDKINSLSDSEFTIEVTCLKKGRKLEGFRFRIIEKRFIDALINIPEENVSSKYNESNDNLFQEISMLCQLSRFNFSPEQIKKIVDVAKRENRDASYMMGIFSAYKQRTSLKDAAPISDEVSYICAMIKNGFTSPKKNASNFTERNYSQKDYDDLEKKLLGYT